MLRPTTIMKPSTNCIDPLKFKVHCNQTIQFWHTGPALNYEQNIFEKLLLFSWLIHGRTSYSAVHFFCCRVLQCFSGAFNSVGCRSVGAFSLQFANKTGAHSLYWSWKGFASHLTLFKTMPRHNRLGNSWNIVLTIEKFAVLINCYE